MIPILNISDGPAIASSEQVDTVTYVPATRDFLIAEHPYRLHLLGEVQEHEIDFGTVRFALVIPEDGWLDPASRAGDYALIQPEPQVPREGLGVQWREENWEVGKFQRDRNTGRIDFIPTQSRTIGEERGYAVALLKPATQIPTHKDRG
jgi:hypothetical protein